MLTFIATLIHNTAYFELVVLTPPANPRLLHATAASSSSQYHRHTGSPPTRIFPYERPPPTTQTDPLQKQGTLLLQLGPVSCCTSPKREC